MNDETRDKLYQIIYHEVAFQQSIGGHAGFSDQIYAVLEAIIDAGFVITHPSEEN